MLNANPTAETGTTVRSTTTAPPLAILAVDDDTHVREMVADALTACGNRVLTAASGAEALRLAGDERFDVVLLDLTLGDMSGLDVMAALRRRPSAPQIVMLTGYATVESAVAAMKLGAHDYLRKPFQLADLEQVVRRAAWAGRIRHAATAGPPAPPAAGVPSLDDVGRQYVFEVLGRTGWNVSQAAKLLRVHRATLYRRLSALGVKAREVRVGARD